MRIRHPTCVLEQYRERKLRDGWASKGSLAHLGAAFLTAGIFIAQAFYYRFRRSSGLEGVSYHSRESLETVQEVTKRRTDGQRKNLSRKRNAEESQKESRKRIN